MENRKEEIAQRLFETAIKFKRGDLSLHEHHPELTHTEIMILVHIRKHSLMNGDPVGVKAGRLSLLLRVSPPTVTQQVNGLVSRGYLIRETDPADKRAVNIRLSDKGLEALRLVGRDIITNLTSLVDYLGEERSLELIDLLSDISEWIETEFRTHQRRTEKNEQ